MQQYGLRAAIALGLCAAVLMLAGSPAGAAVVGLLAVGAAAVYAPPPSAECVAFVKARAAAPIRLSAD